MMACLSQAVLGNNMDRVANLMNREKQASIHKKFSKYTGLKGNPNTRVEGSTDYGLYYDSEGILTGGIGDRIESEEEANKYKNITKEEAIRILMEETIPSHDKGAMELLDRQGIDPSSLSESQLDAVKDVVFQLGSNVDAKFPKMFKAIKEKDFEKASYEAAHSKPGKTSKWMSQTPARVQDFQKRIKMKAVKKQMQKNAQGYNITSEQMEEIRNKMKGRPYSEFLDAVNQFRIME